MGTVFAWVSEWRSECACKCMIHESSRIIMIKWKSIKKNPELGAWSANCCLNKMLMKNPPHCGRSFVYIICKFSSLVCADHRDCRMCRRKRGFLFLSWVSHSHLLVSREVEGGWWSPRFISTIDESIFCMAGDDLSQNIQTWENPKL